ncbi:MAG TPA: hypothetical protein DCQ31_06470 [Bacteroidales bacterium]|nr:hypothetical protein [Bacteroidales bacterium]
MKRSILLIALFLLNIAFYAQEEKKSSADLNLTAGGAYILNFGYGVSFENDFRYFFNKNMGVNFSYSHLAAFSSNTSGWKYFSYDDFEYGEDYLYNYSIEKFNISFLYKFNLNKHSITTGLGGNWMYSVQSVSYISGYDTLYTFMLGNQVISNYGLNASLQYSFHFNEKFYITCKTSAANYPITNFTLLLGGGIKLW